MSPSASSRPADVETYLEREKELADQPMDPGPFEPFLRALAKIQDHFPREGSPIRTALVTARNAPAHKRVIKTLRAWNVRVDETVFLGGVDKSEILAHIRPLVFFDDQMSHLERSRSPRSFCACVFRGGGTGPSCSGPGRRVNRGSGELPRRRGMGWAFWRRS
jgi:5'-nucleotidase